MAKHANQIREIKEQLMATATTDRRQGKWLAQVLRGWMAYYAVPMSASNLCIPASYDERWHGASAPQPAAPINVDPDEDDR